MGGCFGCTLHLTLHERGELWAFALTPGPGDDRTPVPGLTRALWGTRVGDQGYIAQALEETLSARGRRLRTRLRSHRKPQRVTRADHGRLRPRALGESGHDPRKNISQVEHTRHRSPAHCLVNLRSGLMAYGHPPKKPSLTRARSLPETASYP